MSIRGWWERIRWMRRKHLAARRARPGPRLLPRPPAKPMSDDPIQARVDLVRFAAFAEAAAEAIEAGPPELVRMRYDEACVHFGRAIEAAQRAGLAQEVARLKARRSGLRRLFEAMRRTEIRNQKSEVRNKRPEGR
jgi:hypothetical protein